MIGNGSRMLISSSLAVEDLNGADRLVGLGDVVSHLDQITVGM